MSSLLVRRMTRDLSRCSRLPHISALSLSGQRSNDHRSLFGEANNSRKTSGTDNLELGKEEYKQGSTAAQSEIDQKPVKSSMNEKAETFGMQGPVGAGIDGDTVTGKVTVPVPRSDTESEVEHGLGSSNGGDSTGKVGSTISRLLGYHDKEPSKANEDTAIGGSERETDRGNDTNKDVNTEHESPKKQESDEYGKKFYYPVV